MAKPFRIDNCDEGLVQSARHLYIKKLTEYGENVMMVRYCFYYNAGTQIL